MSRQSSSLIIAPALNNVAIVSNVCSAAGTAARRTPFAAARALYVVIVNGMSK